MTPASIKGKVHLRRMTLADLPQVEALDRICFEDPWPDESFLYELRPDSSSICLVAEQSDDLTHFQIIGAIVIWLILDEAHIGTLAVSPEFRGKGIARRLLATALLQSYSAGARTSLLEVRTSNEKALHLYYGLGFEVVGVRPGYYQNHEDAWLLTLKNLDPISLEKLTDV
ncbi:MAG: ribosomal protein S18-alanine N-acetyltransferase [Anaerolineaceae bacterium]|jgi:ribosomal-protein-alanine N-acetyltransferase